MRTENLNIVYEIDWEAPPATPIAAIEDTDTKQTATKNKKQKWQKKVANRAKKGNH